MLKIQNLIDLLRHLFFIWINACQWLRKGVYLFKRLKIKVRSRLFLADWCYRIFLLASSRSSTKFLGSTVSPAAKCFFALFWETNHASQQRKLKKLGNSNSDRWSQDALVSTVDCNKTFWGVALQFPLSKNMHIYLIKDSKLSVGVLVSCDGLETCPGCIPAPHPVNAGTDSSPTPHIFRYR